ncbi:MAG: sigma-70 family RNA polymerase sigma factor [Myxococcota bacterium]
MKTEPRLIEEAQAGSLTAFTALVEHYQPRLLRFLRARCGSSSDAEDALQDTFVNAYRYLYSYDARWAFSTWLYRIAIRNAARYSRAAKKTDEQEAPPGAPDALEQMIKKEEETNLWTTARAVLNDEVYTALWLRYAEEMPIVDVAYTLKRSTSWTKVNLLRARSRLGEALPEGDEVR